MNLEAWDEGCRRGIFGLILAILVFATMAFAGVGSVEFLVILALTIAVLALWSLRLWVSPKPQFLCPPIVWPVLVFAVYAIGRYLTCDIEYVGRWELVRVLVFTFLFLAILNNTYHQDTVVILSFILIFLGMAASSYAVAQYFTHSTHIWWVESSEPGRASGPFFSADHFCGYLEMLLPMTIALILVGRIEPITRILLGYCFVAMLAGITVTFSRAGWVASAMGVLLVLLILLGHRHHRKFAGLTLLLLAVGGTLFVTSFLSRSMTFMQRMVNPETGVNFDIFIRVKVWQAAIRMWLDHFWWGAGPGHFNELFNEYRSPAVQMRAGWVHSDYLNVLTDWGMVGGLLVVAALVVVAWGVAQTWRRVRRSENDFGSGLSNRFACFLGLLGGLVAMMVHSLVDFNMHVPADALLALTLLALLSSNLRFATERYWVTVRLPMKVLVTLVFAAGMGYLGWQGLRLANETRWLVAADKPHASSELQVRLRVQAFAGEPMNFTNAFAIGEIYRAIGVAAKTNRFELETNALGWYRRSEQLNPHFSLSWVREGECLDVLDQSEEAWHYFEQADRHDPNGYYTAAKVGGHYLKMGEYAAARLWLARSLQLQPKNNPVAQAGIASAEQALMSESGEAP